ncbi:MAG: hypothetical protein QGI92_00975 [Dehalococcoidales bacterium]|nr:hypothetical protein [Dehalococcoidales bacterium]MDP7310231.1 hypothetical protein [Dehalococcoidales bacterium]MDP7409223.1 hypothetical protein [Dehalococcoidales bacterium]MDP7675557.1 hypothetical protein [Dehalococcoidales bacterium]
MLLSVRPEPSAMRLVGRLARGGSRFDGSPRTVFSTFIILCRCKVIPACRDGRWLYGG